MAKGRPTKFNDQIKDAMLALYEKGRTDNQVAKAIGVTPRTLRNWRGKHPSFGVIVKDFKNIADEMVVGSLFQRAVGYTHPEEKIFCTKDGAIVRAKTKKHYPPDVQAALRWLENRQPKKWRNKTEVENTGAIELKLSLADKMARARARSRKADGKKED